MCQIVMFYLGDGGNLKKYWIYWVLIKLIAKPLVHITRRVHVINAHVAHVSRQFYEFY